MAKYIPLDALVSEIKMLDSLYHTSKDLSGDLFIQGLFCFLDTVEMKEVDEQQERMSECPFKKVGCEIYEGHILECKGECSWVVDHLKLKQLKAQKNSIRHSMDETPKYPCDILLVTDVNNVFLCRYMENGRPVDRETPYFRGIENGKCWYYCNDIMNIH